VDGYPESFRLQKESGEFRAKGAQEVYQSVGCGSCRGGHMVALPEKARDGWSWNAFREMGTVAHRIGQFAICGRGKSSSWNCEASHVDNVYRNAEETEDCFWTAD